MLVLSDDRLHLVQPLLEVGRRLEGGPVVLRHRSGGSETPGGFFSPLKALLEQGKIKPTPEAIYTCLNRVPDHIALSKQAEISAIEGSYWAMVDTAQALLMSIKILPPRYP